MKMLRTRPWQWSKARMRMACPVSWVENQRQAGCNQPRRLEHAIAAGTSAHDPKARREGRVRARPRLGNQRRRVAVVSDRENYRGRELRPGCSRGEAV